MVRRCWWVYGSLAFVLLLGANPAHAQNAKTAAPASCDDILKAGDAPKAVLAVRAASCMMDQGKNAQAAQLLQRQLEQMEKDGVQGGKGAVENKLQAAAAKVAAYDIHTDEGAEITVDDQVIGKYPDMNPLFLEPGAHVVMARKEKGEAKASVESVAGTLEPLELKLKIKAEPTQWKEVLPDFGTDPEKDKPKSSGKWPGWRIGMLIGGGVLGAGGAAMGVVFTVQSQGYEQQRTDLVASFPLKSQQCASTPNSAECKQVATLVQQRDDASTLGIVGFVVGGVGIATLVTALVLSPKSKDKTNESATAITVMPLPRGAGVSWTGSF